MPYTRLLLRPFEGTFERFLFPSLTICSSPFTHSYSQFYISVHNTILPQKHPNIFQLLILMSSPSPLITLPLLLTALLTQATLTQSTTTSPLATLHDNSQNCTCYTLDSDSQPSYFLYHKFYDFRSLPASQDPPLVTANQRFGTELAQDQSVFNSSEWNRDWGIMNWGKKGSRDAPVAMQNSAQNVYIGLCYTLFTLFFIHGSSRILHHFVWYHISHAHKS